MRFIYQVGQAATEDHNFAKLRCVFNPYDFYILCCKRSDGHQGGSDTFLGDPKIPKMGQNPDLSLGGGTAMGTHSRNNERFGARFFRLSMTAPTISTRLAMPRLPSPADTRAPRLGGIRFFFILHRFFSNSLG